MTGMLQDENKMITNDKNGHINSTFIIFLLKMYKNHLNWSKKSSQQR